MLKSAVCVPTIKDFYYTPHRGSFIGVHRVSKFLNDSGFNNKLFIFPNMKKKAINIDIPGELEYLRPFLENEKLLFFKSYKRFGYEHNYCADLILKDNPHIVFISCFAFCYANESVELAKAIKNKSENAIIAIGGAGVTVFPKFFEKYDVFDFVLPGDCESVLPEFLNNIFNLKIKVQDEFPFIISRTKTFKTFEQFSTVLSSGCPKKCSFCSNHLTSGRKIKTVDIEKIIKELRNIHSNKPVHINFEDDNIFFYKDYFFEVLEIIKRTFPDAKFSCENGIDYLMLNENDMKKLIDSGFKQFNFSLVSTDFTTLNNIKRENNIEHFKQLTEFALKNNVKVFAYFIAGLQNDTFKSVEETINFLTNMNAIAGISPFYPVPGIEGFEDKSIFEKYPPYMFCGSSCYPWNNSLTTEEIIFFFDMVRRKNLCII